jgi:4-amino-4-deoxy-L-arabinose transferase-like glycosyltransferase
MGRSLTALFATLNVLASFLLFRRIAGPWTGLATAAAVAVMPGLVVHAHYLKEDLYLAPLLMLSLHAFLLHLDRRRVQTLAWWGVTTGLALSTKYVALLLPLMYWLVPRIATLPETAAYAREFRRMLAIAGVTFLVVNFPAFLTPEAFLKGLEFEARHAVKGHFVKVWPWEHLFTFHLRYSLAPAMTWLWLALAGAGISLRLRMARPIGLHDRVLLTFVVL